MVYVMNAVQVMQCFFNYNYLDNTQILLSITAGFHIRPKMQGSEETTKRRGALRQPITTALHSAIRPYGQLNSLARALDIFRRR
jgi:hypothetical protein